MKFNALINFILLNNLVFFIYCILTNKESNSNYLILINSLENLVLFYKLTNVIYENLYTFLITCFNHDWIQNEKFTSLVSI